MLFAVLGRACAHMLFEIIAEMRRLEKTQPACDLLYAPLRVLQHDFGLSYRFVGDPRTYGSAGLAADHAGQVINMKKLHIGIILYPQRYFSLPFNEIPEMLLQIPFEGLYDLRASVTFIYWVVVLEEIFFDLKQQRYYQTADDPVLIGRMSQVLFVYLLTKPAGHLKLLLRKYPGLDRLRKQERKITVYILVHVFFQVRLIECDQAGILDSMPFEDPVITRVGEIDGTGFDFKTLVVDRILAVCLFYKKKTEVIGPEGYGSIRKFFESLLQVMYSKARRSIYRRKSHGFIEFVKIFNDQVMRSHTSKVKK